MAFTGRPFANPDPANQITVALFELGGEAEESLVFQKVVQLFGDQFWTKTTARFHIEITNHLAGGHNPYFTRLSADRIEITALGRTKASIERRLRAGSETHGG